MATSDGLAHLSFEQEPVTIQDVTTEIYASQEILHWGETIEIQVKNNGAGSYDQYTALELPDGDLFFLLNENEFVLDIQPWASSSRMDSIPVTVMKLPYIFDMPHGTYRVYNLLVPAGTSDIFQNINNWILHYTDFVVE